MSKYQKYLVIGLSTLLALLYGTGLAWLTFAIAPTPTPVPTIFVYLPLVSGGAGGIAPSPTPTSISECHPNCETPTSTPTSMPMATPTPTSTLVPTLEKPTSTLTPTLRMPTRTATHTPMPTNTPTNVPTHTPTPTSTPTPTPIPPVAIDDSVQFQGYWYEYVGNSGQVPMEGVVTFSEYRTWLPGGWYGGPVGPSGVFVVLLMDVTNHGSHTASVSFFQSFAIEDILNNTYAMAAWTPLWAAAKDYDRETAGDDIDPGSTEPLVFVFDVPILLSQGLQLVSISPW